MKKKIIFTLVGLFIFTGCGNKNFFNPIDFVEINEKRDEKDNLIFGEASLLSSSDADFEVIFFDINCDVSDDGKTVVSPSIPGISPSDCYLVKSGTTEILVDCGINTSSETYFNLELSHLLNKIKRYIEGDLDYLIISHGDSDHIAGIETNYGSATARGMFEEIEKGTFPQINTLIDFDSEMVRYYCSTYYNDVPESWIYKSSPYKSYTKKRDDLINKGYIKNYASSSYLFSENNINNKNGFKLLNNAKPIINDKQAEALQKYTYLIPNDVEQLNEKVAKNIPSFIKNDHVGSIGGKLINISNKKSDFVYLYTIELNENAQFNILYNWYYNHVFKNNFDKMPLQGSNGGTLANNVSLGFMIVSPTCKFLSLGDMGGSAESGLLKYYKDTNVFKGITCYKASHHGSTNNNENNFILKEYGSKIVYIPNVMLKNRHLGLDSQDPLYNKLASQASVSQDFINNTKTKFEDTIILASETISWSEDVPTNFYYTPFYGDVHISFYNKYANYCYSFGGDVNAYINKDNKNYTFKTFGDSLLRLQDTEWFKMIGYTY